MQLEHFVDGVDTEISGLARSHLNKDGDVIVDEFKIFKQVCTGGSTDLDSADMSKWIGDLAKKGKDTKDWNVWWHSHAHISSYWSTTDDNTIESHAGGIAYIISIVTNKKKDIKARLDIFPKNDSPFEVKKRAVVTEENLDVEVEGRTLNKTQEKQKKTNENRLEKLELKIELEVMAIDDKAEKEKEKIDEKAEAEKEVLENKYEKEMEDAIISVDLFNKETLEKSISVKKECEKEIKSKVSYPRIPSTHRNHNRGSSTDLYDYGAYDVSGQYVGQGFGGFHKDGSVAYPPEGRGFSKHKIRKQTARQWNWIWWEDEISSQILNEYEHKLITQWELEKRADVESETMVIDEDDDLMSNEDGVIEEKKRFTRPKREHEKVQLPLRDADTGEVIDPEELDEDTFRKIFGYDKPE